MIEAYRFTFQVLYSYRLCIWVAIPIFLKSIYHVGCVFCNYFGHSHVGVMVVLSGEYKYFAEASQSITRLQV
jgi:hypothetical protein